MDAEALIASLGPKFLTCDFQDVLTCPKRKDRNFLVICTPVHFSFGHAPGENSVSAEA
jgi:hypothetical protein